MDDQRLAGQANEAHLSEPARRYPTRRTSTLVDAPSTPENSGEESRRPGRPRDTDSRETRLVILEAALVEFAGAGLAGTPTRLICKRAGVTAATVYYHFGSKRSLYIEAFQHAIQLAYDRYELAVAGQPTVRDELRAMLRCALGIMADRHEITALAIRAQSDLTPRELDENFDPEASRDFVAGVTRRAIDREELLPKDAEHLNLIIAGLLWGLSIVGRDNDSRGIYVDAFERLIDATLLQVRVTSAGDPS
ncbi:MAG: TetR/AcrR family transcriptional regulator [Ilumatobacteraceae bacterium]